MSKLEDLLDEIRELEKRVGDEISREADELGYTLQQGKARFKEEVIERHKEMATDVRRYIAGSSWPILLTVPIIYSLSLPLLLLDLFASLYQRICFPIYGIPKVKRREFFIFDRLRLKYLNPIERVHCTYCSYANGLLAYTMEIAARTEQYWCPIKHAASTKATHSRYYHFLSYGDAEGYATRLKELRKEFKKLD